MRLKNLHIERFRCFEQLGIEFDPEMTILVAPNGGGKTTVLDAVADVMAGFISSFHPARHGSLSHNDVRRVISEKSGTPVMEPSYPLRLQVCAEIEGRELCWSRTLETRKTKGKSGQTRDLTKVANALAQKVWDHESVELPILAYYGTGRLWRENRLTKSRAEKAFDRKTLSRTHGYADALNPSSNFRIFARWLLGQSMSVFFLDADSGQKAARDRIQESINCVKGAVNTVLEITGWKDIRFDGVRKTVTAKHDVHGEMAVDDLSDGIRTMLGLAADIAFRMVQLNPHHGGKAANSTPGIILIDEVDMHLHPQWQQVVLASLRKAFPRVQFIVTTHSPHVLSTAHANQIRLLVVEDGANRAAQPLESPYGRESQLVLESLMGVPGRPPVPEAMKLKEYMNLIEQDRFDCPEALQLREELTTVFGAASEELSLADFAIARWKALRKKRHAG